jgi:hypothetical protein
MEWSAIPEMRKATSRPVLISPFDVHNAPFRRAGRVKMPSFKARNMGSQVNFLHDNAEKRLVFIDALRVAAIAFVIVHHAAQAYGRSNSAKTPHI